MRVDAGGWRWLFASTALPILGNIPRMCGRFFLTADPAELAEYFGLAEIPSIEPRYNVAPGQTVPVIVQGEAGRSMRKMGWGLIPSWTKDPAIGYRSINARVETVAEKPTFRTASKKRHCLVPATGFYEWKTVGKKKLPTAFRLRSGLFAFAGLWEKWRDCDSALETFTILTAMANEVVGKLHDRMPVVLPQEAYEQWLGNALGHELLQPFPAGEMTAAEANPWVNAAHHEGPRCLEPNA